MLTQYKSWEADAQLMNKAALRRFFYRRSAVLVLKRDWSLLAPVQKSPLLCYAEQDFFFFLMKKWKKQKKQGGGLGVGGKREAQFCPCLRHTDKRSGGGYGWVVSRRR